MSLDKWHVRVRHRLYQWESERNMIQATALNVLIIGLSMIIFSFLFRSLAQYLADRNPESGVAKAMAVIL
jgi:hypothetical protein